MSNVEKPFDKAELDRQLQEAEGDLRSQHADLQRDLGRLRINVKTMRDIVGDTVMEGIIVYHARFRSYYKGIMPKKGERPDCFSPNGITGHGDNGTGDGQHDCVNCAMAKFGSSQRGSKKGMACRIVRALAFHRLDPQPIGTPEIEIVQIPPTGLTAVATFLEEFIKAKKLYFTHKVRISLQGGETGIFVFERGPELSDDMKFFALQHHKSEKVATQRWLELATNGGEDEDNRSDLSNAQITG